MQVPFFEFRDFLVGIKAQTEQAVLQVLRNKQLILGPKVDAFEKEFAAFIGVDFCVGVGNGYDALVLALKVSGIGKGDKVLLPANGFIAAVNAVVAVGAQPVFAEPDAVTASLTAATAEKHLSNDIKAILPVYLYGLVSEAAELKKLCAQREIILIEDFAQAQGAVQNGKQAGSFGHVSATSFYPTKNLGAAGDAGAVCTNNAAMADQLRVLRNYGQRTRYINETAGVNSRLDEVQAAVLLEKLKILPLLNEERTRIAKIYSEELKNTGDLILPPSDFGLAHTWHLYVIKTHHRDLLQQFLAQKGIVTLIHYPVPPYGQPAYQHLQIIKGTFPITDQLAGTSLSLPLFPGLTASEQAYVVEKVKEFFRLK